VSLVALFFPAAAAALLDLTLGAAIVVLGGHPSFSVAVVAVWAALRPREEAMVIAPVAGLLLGLLGHEPLGASMVALAPVVLLGCLRDPASVQRRLAAALGTACAGGAAYVAVVALIEGMALHALPPASVTLGAMAGTALASTVLALVLYWPVGRFAWRPATWGDVRRV
jgi:rod shape-determining protein MreD